MIWVAFIILGFAFLRLVISFINYAGAITLRGEDDAGNAMVSVLIPARNEEKHIGMLLDDLMQVHYPEIEIIVYNDQSEDNTAEVVRKKQAADRRIQLIDGDPLPDGWLGKPRACHELASRARGDYLLFLDADVRIKKELVGHSVGHLMRNRLSLLSIFPEQIMITPGEKITVPVMNWILLSLLPLVMTKVSRWCSFSAANGQFMLFDAAVYREYWFHSMVRDQKVEDIMIMRKMKKFRLNVQTLVSDGSVSCRMYEGFREAVYGFSKNVREYFGGSFLMMTLFALMTTFGFIPVMISLSPGLLALYISVIIMIRILISATSKQNILVNVILMPLQQLSFMMMVMLSITNHLKGRYIWKGRVIR